MRAPAVLAAAVCVIAAGWTGAATAASACAAPHRQCLAQCDAKFPPKPDDLGHAGCFARCGWDQATCEAKRAVDEGHAALERAKPALEAELNRWQRLLDGFRQGGAGSTPIPDAAPAPRAKPEPVLPPEPGSRRTTPL